MGLGTLSGQGVPAVLGRVSPCSLLGSYAPIYTVLPVLNTYFNILTFKNMYLDIITLLLNTKKPLKIIRHIAYVRIPIYKICRAEGQICSCLVRKICELCAFIIICI